jgi:hypothetical protein
MSSGFTKNNSDNPEQAEEGLRRLGLFLTDRSRALSV